jgi:hypothetical protein
MRSPPRAFLLVLLIAGCSFDQTGLNTQLVQDAPQGVDDAPASGTPDAPQAGNPDARVVDAKPATPPDANTGVTCGNQTCTGGDLCCVPFGGGNGGTDLTCAASCPPGTSGYACDGPEDCASGSVCCISRGGSSCTDVNSCGGWNGGNVACRVATDCPTQGDQCCPVQNTDVSICAQVCF